MIKKTNPIIFRIDKSHKSRAKSQWFADKKRYSKELLEDHKIRSYIESLQSCSSLDEVLIKRNGTRVQVVIRVAQIGAVIGRQGAEIESIRAALRKIIKHDNVLVEAEEVAYPNLSARIVANNIARQIEKRIRAPFAMREASRAVMKDGARGFKVVISGRHGGTDIARIEKRQAGSVPTQTLRQDIRYAQSRANTTYGVLGVKVWIALGDYSQSSKFDKEPAHSSSKRKSGSKKKEVVSKS